MNNFFCNPSFPLVCSNASEYTTSLSGSINEASALKTVEVTSARELFDLYFSKDQYENDEKSD